MNEDIRRSTKIYEDSGNWAALFDKKGSRLSFMPGDICPSTAGCSGCVCALACFFVLRLGAMRRSYDEDARRCTKMHEDATHKMTI